MEQLKTFLETMSLAERAAFATRCGTTAGHLRNISYGYKPCGESLAVNIDRESAGQVPAEKLAPEVDWEYLRRKWGRRAERKNVRRAN